MVTLLSALLSVWWLMPHVAAAQTCAGFPDLMQADRACAAVSRLVELKVVNGYPDGTFKPDNKLTRAEFAKLLVAALRVQPDPTAPVPFPDAQEHWSAKMGYLQAAVKMGALNGFPDGSFRPDAPVTRAQAVKIIVAAAGLSEGPAMGLYSDTADTWYQNMVELAAGHRLIGAEATHQVFDGAQFGGDEPASRAEAAMLLANLLNL
jgi:hypothetical protein